ncbi:cell division protein FtsW [Brumimicrobium salinarum]|uniref:Probable peptidoglycan glycosyltransferase FtsW n=1 Tax=Brumimicrobium salinarum TaxID=2058658 RepID=A0A2I0QZV2_9FLAO|nr:FtsW/RodA/SpoVE family cell cycle protein [Brumimicrobium salinarum]PKR79839.1 cell division protein FtsW [Brumimicrobium salinarum]
MQNIFKYLKGDNVIWVITILLLGLSTLSVYSFVPILVKTAGGTPFGYLFKHIIYIAIGFSAMYWIHRQDPKYVERLSKFIFYLAIGLLIFTFFFGVRVNDASRWVRIPIIGLTFQSSDFAKLALVIFLSRRLITNKDSFDSWKKSLFKVIFPILLICALIAKDNFSTAALIFLVSLLILFIGKFPLSKLLGGIGIGLLGLLLFVLLHLALPAMNILPRFDTWMNRFFKAYGEGGASVENMQAINAKLAIHNGGYTGVGVGDGDLKHYTPEAYADFFYSSFVEEFGLIGAILLVFLYLILFYRILKIGLNAKHLFETYLSIGIGLLLLSQALVNMFVCTGLMPVTGQNMPFLAMGGSAMVMSCISLGIVLAIARKNETNGKDVSAMKNEVKNGN